MPPKNITATYGVSEQIRPTELSQLSELGYAGIICNLPDGEVSADVGSEAMARAAEKLGLSFTYNPISHAGLTQENLTTQADALSGANGPVVAYCRSGQRSAICWAILSAAQEKPDAVISAVASAGYNLEGLRPHFEAMYQG